VSERKPGEDLGIGWGVQEDPQTDAMGVNDARDWTDTGAAEDADDPGAPHEDTGEDDQGDTQGTVPRDRN